MTKSRFPWETDSRFGVFMVSAKSQSLTGGNAAHSPDEAAAVLAAVAHAAVAEVDVPGVDRRGRRIARRENLAGPVPVRLGRGEKRGIDRRLAARAIHQAVEFGNSGQPPAAAGEFQLVAIGLRLGPGAAHAVALRLPFQTIDVVDDHAALPLEPADQSHCR